MNLNNLLIIIFFSLPPLVFIFYLYFSGRCPMGGQHKCNLIDSKFVKGNDIGFGITNSYVLETYKCIKCDHTYEAIN